MDNFIDFSLNKEKYKIGIFNHKNSDKIPFTDDDINKIYYKCFDSNTNLNNLNNDLNLNLFILDKNDKLIFIATIILNNQTKNIEIYNVCKDLNHKNLASGLVIKKFIEYFIKPIFYPNYKRIVLSVLFDNKFIVPTILCYLNVGFNLLKKQTNMLYVNQPHFKMYLNLKKTVILNKYQKILIFYYILYFYFWDLDKLNNIYQKLTGKIYRGKNIYKVANKILIYLIDNLKN